MCCLWWEIWSELTGRISLKNQNILLILTVIENLNIFSIFILATGKSEENQFVDIQSCFRKELHERALDEFK